MSRTIGKDGEGEEMDGEGRMCTDIKQSKWNGRERDRKKWEGMRVQEETGLEKRNKWKGKIDLIRMAYRRNSMEEKRRERKGEGMRVQE